MELYLIIDGISQAKNWNNHGGCGGKNNDVRMVLSSVVSCTMQSGGGDRNCHGDNVL